MGYPLGLDDQRRLSYLWETIHFSHTFLHSFTLVTILIICWRPSFLTPFLDVALSPSLSLSLSLSLQVNAPPRLFFFRGWKPITVQVSLSFRMLVMESGVALGQPGGKD
jgi:hypothetical protein